MSGLLQGSVYYIRLSAAEQRVMLALADHGQDEGTNIYPGVGYLAWKLDLTERRVQQVLRVLEKKRLLIPTEFSKGGRGHATKYEMHLENGVRKAPYMRADGTVAGRPDPLRIMNLPPDAGDVPDAQGWTTTEAERVASRITGILHMHATAMKPLTTILRQYLCAPAYLEAQAVNCQEWHHTKGQKVSVRLFDRWLHDEADHREVRLKQLHMQAESEQKSNGQQQQQSAAPTARRDEQYTPEQIEQFWREVNTEHASARLERQSKKPAG